MPLPGEYKRSSGNSGIHTVQRNDSDIDHEQANDHKSDDDQQNCSPNDFAYATPQSGKRPNQATEREARRRQAIS
jgi:hypothetical protein